MITASEMWAQQISEHTRYSYDQLEGSTEERWVSLEKGDADIYIITYAGLQYLIGKKDKKKRKLIPDNSKIKKLGSLFDFLILDEVQKCKNRKSLTYKLCMQLQKHISHIYGLTGTPTGTDPIDFWSQFYLIDSGETLGNITLYRAAFFSEVLNPFGGWKTWVFKKSKTKTLHRLLQNKSLLYEEAELKELPKVTEIKIPIPMSDAVIGYYKKVKDSRKKQNKIEVLDIKNKFMKLRQLCSGFLIVNASSEDIDVKKASTTVSLDTNKLNWFSSVIPDMINEPGKIVVFYDFTYSGKLLEECLNTLGIEYVSIRGGMDNRKALKKFTVSDISGPRIAIVNSKSGASSLNLQVANKVIFYELPVGLITYQQAMRRCHRTGQTRKVFFYYLLRQGSLEERRLQSLKEGQELLDLILKGKESF